MKKQAFLLFALFGLVLQSAVAVPAGWYDLSANWRDGSFEGKIFYDSASASAITQANGHLDDLAHTTTITSVWNTTHESTDDWVFLDNANGTDIDGYDTGFYLNLVDLGASLAIDASKDNGLYDWSSNFAFYSPQQLNDSPLISWDIHPVHAVPEPSSALLLCLGLALLGHGLARRRRRPVKA